MSDEHDSWFKDAFGVDLGQSLNKIKDEGLAVIGDAKNKVTQVVQGVQGAVEGALDGVTSAAAGVVKKVAGAVAPSGSPNAGPAGASGGGTGSFPLGGSVGRGGKNAPNDVRAVQAALGISADGQCGGGTIAAIEAFQRNMGQPKPDGRVDAGGGTERALAGGASGASAAAPAPAPAKEDDDSGSFFDQAVEGVKDLGGKILKEADEKTEGLEADADIQAKEKFTAEVKAEFAKSVDDFLLLGPDLIRELDDLDNFRDFDPLKNTQSFEQLKKQERSELESKINGHENLIAVAEKARTSNIAKTRAEARAAIETIRRELLTTIGAVAAASFTFLGLIAVPARIVQEVTAKSNAKQSIRKILDNGKIDIKGNNTEIANKKDELATMKKAADSQPDVAIDIRPFRRPADAPVDELDPPVDELDK